MPRLVLLALLSTPAIAQYSVQDLTFSSHGPTDRIGLSVDGAASWAIIGGDDGHGSLDGSAYLVSLFTGAELAELQPPPVLGAGSEFGTDVGIMGSWCVVGAPGALGGDGRAVVYDAPSGSLNHILAPSVPGTRFGTRVSSRGFFTTVASPLGGPSAEGAIDVFHSQTGAHQYQLTHPNPGFGIRFGPEHSTDGIYLYVRAAGPFGDDAVHVFNVSTGAPVFTLHAFPPTTHEGFGMSIQAKWPHVVVGAPLAHNGATQSGAAYVFGAISGQQLRRLSPPGGTHGDRFGASVSMDNERIVCGAPGANRIHVFDADTGVEAARLEQIGVPEFGSDVANNIGWIVAGAPEAQGGAGDAWLYTAEVCQVVLQCPQPPNSTGLEGQAEVISCSLDQGAKIHFSNLPGGFFGYPLIGQGQTPIHPPGANGSVCLGGGSPIGRYINDIVLVNTEGTVTFDPVNGPTGAGNASLPDPPGGTIGAGDTYGFQFWSRDQGNTSSFTRLVRVTFKP